MMWPHRFTYTPCFGFANAKIVIKNERRIVFILSIPHLVVMCGEV